MDEAFERQLSNYYTLQVWKSNLLIPTNGGVAPDFLAACKLMEVKNTKSSTPQSLVSNVIIKKATKTKGSKLKLLPCIY